MFIKSKFMSICPICNGMIAKDEQVWWTKGSKAIHTQCKHVTIDEIIESHNKSNPKIKLEYVGLENNLHRFTATRTFDNKTYDVYYTKSGERIDPETRKRNIDNLILNAQRYR
jgi:hypothetical protein